MADNKASVISQLSTPLNLQSTMKFFVIAALLAVVAADGSYKTEEYTNVQVPHSFAWEVKDAESYNDYSHNHNNDGKGTTGSYRVVLPDGRTQIVKYTSDSYRGYEVDVQFEGEAKYDDVYQVAKPVYQVVKPVYQAPRPVYQPYRPVYQAYRPVYQVYKPVQYTTTPKAVEYTTTTTTEAPTTQAPVYPAYPTKKHPAWYFNTNKN